MLFIEKSPQYTEAYTCEYFHLCDWTGCFVFLLQIEVINSIHNESDQKTQVISIYHQ